MRSSDENLVRFIRRVHRRLVVVRALERSGACVAVASIFACLFATVALVQGRDAMQLVLPTLAIGALAGLIWGLAARPTRFDAVIEADRQLDLADLLATAYARRGDDDPWQRAVVAIADQRCRALAPAAVVVHRYGGRAWGGIGLSAALGLTLALLSGVPQDSRARTATNAKPAATVSAAETVESPQARTADASSAAAEARAKIAAAESRAGIRSESPAANDPDGRASDNALTRPGSDGSGGERAGQTSAAAGDALPRPAAAGEDDHDNAANAATIAGGGATAGGPVGSPKDAAAARAAEPAGAPAGRTIAGGRRPHAAPWSSPSWPADRAAAGQAIRAGRVPDAYRDVVSAYFDDADIVPAAPPVSPR
jgi:hypothetical protein